MKEIMRETQLKQKKIMDYMVSIKKKQALVGTNVVMPETSNLDNTSTFGKTNESFRHNNDYKTFMKHRKAS
jgi:hypothetical protein